MRTLGVLTLVAGLGLGVGLTLLLTGPEEAQSKTIPNAVPLRAAAPDFPESGTRKPAVERPTPAVSERSVIQPDADAVVPQDSPANGQKLELSGGLVVRWQRGGNQIAGWQKDRRVWLRELAFAVADVVRGATPDELRVASVDALSHVVLDAPTGKLRTVPGQTGQALQAGDPAADLLREVKALHADALAKMRAGDGRATLAACDRMGELANRLADAKRQNEAFRIWAAATKLRRAVAPQAVGREQPKEEQPRVEDLEF